MATEETPTYLETIERARQALPKAADIDLPILETIGALRGVAEAERAALVARTRFLARLVDDLGDALDEAVAEEHPTPEQKYDEYDEFDV